MGACVSHDENVVMPQVMDLLQHLPDHPKIRYAKVLVVARYTSWTKKHPNYVPFQLQLIANGFQDSPDVVPASAMALKFLCRECPEVMVDFIV